MKKIILLFFITTSLLTGRAQDLSYKTDENIAYIDQPVDSYQRSQCQLDIYHPTSGDLKPIIIWYHGGSLTGGRKEVPEFLKNKGFVVVGVGYRLSPQAKVEDIIRDAARAVAFVVKNADKYHGDTSKLFLSGHSAGGYLALMLGLNKAYLQREGINANSLAGIIPFSGQAITHFTARKEQGIADTQPTVGELAPLYWVRKDASPIVLLSGDRELEMLGRYEENAYLRRMLLIAGHQDVRLIEFQGYGHDMTYPGFPVLVNEIKRILKEKEAK